MKSLYTLCAVSVACFAMIQNSAAAREIAVTLTVPSTAYRVTIDEIYNTGKEIWVLSQVKGGGIGLTVITKAKDSVKVEAPKDLPVRHFVLGKTWNWTQEKNYIYLKSRKQFEGFVKQAKAKRIYKRRVGNVDGANQKARYIVMYRKEIFKGGKTKDGLTLKELAEKHAKQFKGKVGRILRIINGYTIELTPEAARKLGQLPEVRAIELDRPLGINPPRPPIRRDDR